MLIMNYDVKNRLVAIHVVTRAGKQRNLGSNPLWLSFLFKSCGLWTLFCDFVPHNQWNVKMALIAARLNAGVTLVVTV